MKKAIVVGMTALIILVVAVGCTPTPTPTPTIQPTVNPTPSPVVTTPMVTSTPAVSPDITASPTAASIADFKEGTIIKDTDVPDIYDVFHKQYADATLGEIKHGMMQGAQVYVITYKDKDNKDQTMYIAPDGTMYSESGVTISPITP